VYFRTEGAYGEREVLALAVPGEFGSVKGFLERLFEKLRVPFEIEARSWKFLQGGRSAALVSRGRLLGCVGEPASELHGDLQSAIAVAELDFAALAELAALDRRVSAFSRQPPVKRDVTVWVGEDVPWARVASVAREGAPSHLERLEFVSEYRGAPVPSGKRSLTFSLVFRSPERTLTSDEVETAERAIVIALASSLGAERR
jgi:phenylalanyl-tRNA synthetase beta chain